MSVADVCGPARSEPGAPLSVGVAPRREGWRGLGGSPSLWGSEELWDPKLLSLKALCWLGHLSWSELQKTQHYIESEANSSLF